MEMLSFYTRKKKMEIKSTRDRILQTLLNHPRSTIEDLAHAVNINGISVRHHITNLQIDRLVLSEEVRHGVGRPRLVYSLTSSGVESFPTRYLYLTDKLLSQLKQRLPHSEVEKIFVQIARDLAEENAAQVKKLSIEGKLIYLQQKLADEGFTLAWEKNADEYRVSEVTCPFYHLSQSHPEVCTLDQTLLSTLLSVPIERISCILSGENQCTYLIKQKTNSGA
jgi:DeoR family transcriptional regulator, suf operon transcriptional repressor